MTDKTIWVERAEKWLWDSCGYAPDTSVEELAEWMEKAEKLEAVKTHMESAPDRVQRDNWLRPTKSFLLQVLDWIIAHRKILGVHV